MLPKCCRRYGKCARNMQEHAEPDNTRVHACERTCCAGWPQLGVSCTSLGFIADFFAPLLCVCLISLCLSQLALPANIEQGILTRVCAGSCSVCVQANAWNKDCQSWSAAYASEVRVSITIRAVLITHFSNTAFL